ncbi:MAG: thiamine-phosphate kinase [Gammaproteobacteria bacterium]|nr:thiamine-phosphate kinase [Gammaproteobacteria bacterium]
MEFDLIKRLTELNSVQREDVILGIGDDAARLLVPDGHELIVSMDTLVSGVHFPENTTPQAIGYKALAVNLSDLAAMGAEPAWVTLALTMPQANSLWLEAFAQGFLTLAREHNVQLIGGDTTQGPLSITVQAHGFTPRGQALTRAGAKVGDYIAVTGYLGDAGRELKSLNKSSPLNDAINRLNYPYPRVQAGLALLGIATACIDISDGLIADLGHILERSQVGARVLLDKIPISEASLHSKGFPVLELALTAGDDYELCFTFPESRIDDINKIQHQLSLPMTHIGFIEETRGLRLHRPDGRPIEIANNGYQHFSKKK